MNANRIEVVAVLAYPAGTVLAPDLTATQLLDLSVEQIFAKSSLDAPVGVFKRGGHVERIVRIEVPVDGFEHQMAKSSARLHENALAHQLAVLVRAFDTGRLSDVKVAVLEHLSPGWRSAEARVGYRSPSDTDASLDRDFDEQED